MAESGTSGAGGTSGAVGMGGAAGTYGTGGSPVRGSRARGARGSGGRGSGAATDPDLPAAVLDQWRAVADHLDGLPDTAFAAPSALPGWTTAELVMHTARSALSLSEALTGRRGTSGETPEVAAGEVAGPATAVPAATAATDVPTTTAVDYLAGTGARAEAIADRARALAADRSPDLVSPDLVSPDLVRAAFRDAVTAAAADLADLADLASVGGGEVADRLVGTPGGIMRLGEFLLTRAVEAVVHGLDLGVTPRRPALKAVVRLFTAVLVERAPGRSVELRVPPFSAVQIVEGPRHTRGTPPNVVEADAQAFVLLATGRLAWESAVGDGRIRASGERADLRRLLPLLA